MVKKNTVKLVAWIIVGTIAIALIITFNQTSCTEVEVIRLGIKMGDFIDSNIEKKCVRTLPPSSLGEKTEQIIDKKSEIAAKDDLVRTKEAELKQIENETLTLIKGAKEKENIQQILETKTLELEVTKKELEKAKTELMLVRENFETNYGTITVAPTTEEEKQTLLWEINRINYVPTVEFDQKIYTWTDKVFISIIDPASNKDPNKIDMIGTDKNRKIIISTKNAILDYVLMESSYDTGIFTGEFFLSGFGSYDANGDGNLNDATGYTFGFGPTDGHIVAHPEDTLKLTYEFEDRKMAVGSALVRWYVADSQWLEQSYLSTGQGIIRVIDPDLNLNPEGIDSFKIHIWSTSDQKGIDVTVTETNESTAIFEGSVNFTSKDSSGNSLKVAEGDEVDALYIDLTLPPPYDLGDGFGVFASTKIID